MGGDLIDTIESDGSLLVHVADVSGHGLAAGQLMGMLKTAIRVSRQLGQQPVATLERTLASHASSSCWFTTRHGHSSSFASSS
jgi:serine phosphatase RsbU (regulator of sigma subunit)